jgi:predicted SprT family Zn-dependent metalloprotease
MKQKCPAGENPNYDLFAAIQGVTIPAVPVPEEKESNPVSAQLPSLPELLRMFGEINRRYFQGTLPEAKISYSKRMMIAGSYTPVKREIKIGIKYHRLFPNEIEDTLKHEMIHILHPNHNREFRLEAKRIGASMKAKSHPQLRKPPVYIYVCPRCGKEYPRQKRLRMASCGACSARGKFDPRCKLKRLTR